MESLSATTLRVIIVVIGVLLLAGIYFFGRPRNRRKERRLPLDRPGNARVEPVLGDPGGSDSTSPDASKAAPRQGELNVGTSRESTSPGPAASVEREPAAHAGRREPNAAVDRIVTLYVVAHDDATFSGSDIAVAAEKVGLKFGAMHIYHRLVDARPDAQPVFSMANMVKPGSFDMERISEFATSGITFFITLPGPLPALDAWEAMVPTARRMAELLDGQLLDEDHSSLGRQRIAGMREALRDWDRQHEGGEVESPLLH